MRGKILGIVGYGHIGSQLSILAESIGMQVVFYDKQNVMGHGLAKSMSSMEEVLAESDFVTIHVPDAEDTCGLIGRDELAKMKKGAYFINASRGKIVDLDALADALEDGHLKGAAIDVYPDEPAANGPCDAPCRARLSRTCSNVILTPHIGGSTEEAQRAIGEEVATSMLRYVQVGSSVGSVSFPELELRARLGASQCRLLNVHRNVPGVLKSINKLLAERNIASQRTDSRDEVAYLAADLDEMASLEECKKLLENVRALNNSILTRIIHPVHGHLFEGAA